LDKPFFIEEEDYKSNRALRIKKIMSSSSSELSTDFEPHSATPKGATSASWKPHRRRNYGRSNAALPRIFSTEVKASRAKSLNADLGNGPGPGILFSLEPNSIARFMSPKPDAGS
jgi:hypothetical protein